MTLREKETLIFLIDYREKHGFSPTIKEICAGINTKSTCHVKIMLEHLKRDGMIDYLEGQSRTITIKEKCILER